MNGWMLVDIFAMNKVGLRANMLKKTFAQETRCEQRALVEEGNYTYAFVCMRYYLGVWKWGVVLLTDTQVRAEEWFAKEQGVASVYTNRGEMVLSK